MNQHVMPPISTYSDASAHELVTEILTAVSDILLTCGVSRDEIFRGIASALDSHQRVHRDDCGMELGSMQRECMEVMCVWRRDPRYLAADGLPATLSLDGEEPSFISLCKRVSAESEPDRLLSVLFEFGAIRRRSDGRISANTPTFLLCGAEERAVATDGVLKQLAGFVQAIDFNTRQAVVGGRPRFERSCTVTVAAELLPVFERVVRERGQMFIDVLDEWLERHRDTRSTSNTYVEIGAGAYFVNRGIINSQ